MRLSKYTIVYGNYLFNTATLSVLKVGNLVIEAIKSDDIDKMPEQIREALLREGYLVEDSFDEHAYVEFRLRTKRYDTRSLSVTYIPGYKCNFACTYCYASLQVHNRPLDERPSDNLGNLLDWLSKQLTTIQPRVLDFSFHGGEPLMYAKYMIKVARAVSKLGERRGAYVGYNVVTNGSLLSPNLYRRLQEIDINKFLITVDGPPPVHDIRRVNKDNTSTYNKILDNALNVLANGGTIIMSTNIDSQNKNSITELLDNLSKKGFGQYPNFRFVAAAVLRGPGSELLPHFDKYPPLDLKEFARVKVEAYRYAAQKGIRTSYPFGIGLCSLKMPNAYIIDSNDNIYKCTTLVGHSESWVGTLSEDMETLSRRVSQLDMAEPWAKNERCQQCIYLPMCVGSCPQQAMLKLPQTPFPHGIWCPKEFLDEYVPAMLKVLDERNTLFPELAKID